MKDRQRAPELTPPALPVNWYMLAGSREVRRGRVITRSLFGQEYVLYRSPATGQVTVFAAHCAHMGCHLKHATPQEDGLRCALHHRLIGFDGAFTTPDGRKSAQLVQPRLTAREHMGGVFVWIGPRGSETPLPEPAIAGNGPVMARYVGQFEFDTSWYSLMANGLDMEHLSAVHGRVLREDPVIETGIPGRFRISYLTRVIGTSLSDRVVKWLSGDHIRASMMAVNGSMMLVESDVARPSFVILSVVPRGDGGTIARALMGSTGEIQKPLDALRMRVTSWLFKRFFEADFGIFDGLDWHPPEAALTRPDTYSQSLYRYFCQQENAADV
ncbi:Rieske 2Fe-2S domain-containing protein [Arenibacterium sp. CAU 1754]